MGENAFEATPPKIKAISLILILLDISSSSFRPSSISIAFICFVDEERNLSLEPPLIYVLIQ
ncbi:hypothetical protein Ancab_023060, partial [Ancistrocladus abbreviatus]